ncbi:MAG TPA: peptidyl-prolyl cis-trans isomerase [Candidatus Polarisedimenticolia bacterium]|nr:peptidyl-prolyl cis-trans isomerase [Candidatus Polarisedimenticolia bacterium]
MSTTTEGPGARLKRALGPLLLAALALAPTGARAAIVEEIVAKVNNRIITKSEFEERGAFIMRQVYQQYSGQELDRQVQESQDTLLANMITELLLLEKAQTLLDLDKVRKNLIDDFRKQQQINSDEDLDKVLKEQKMTRKDLEEQLVRLAIPQEIINYEVKRKISVSEREVSDYYQKHQKDWESPPSVSFREIVLFYEDVTRPEVLARAQGIVRESKGGADYADLVQRYSEAGTKDGGGLLGPVTAADLHPGIAAAAFDLAPGDVSEPVDTGRSFHIIRLEAKTPRLVKPQEEVHDVIYEAIRQEKLTPRYDAYLRKIWRESQVEVMPKYEKFLITSPLKPKPGA